MPVDLFISHASEDKDSVARPLALALRERGWSVWFDEFELTLGDSLRRKIDRGLAEARFGLVILSPAFFAKEWPQRELDGLNAREVAGPAKVILPVWHRVDHEYVARFSPPLADRLATSSERGIQAIADEVERVLQARSNPSIFAMRRPGPQPSRWSRGRSLGMVAAVLIGGGTALTVLTSNGTGGGDEAARRTAGAGSAPSGFSSDVSIRPGQGIGPVALRSSKEDVDATLGATSQQGPLNSGLEYRSPTYGDFHIEFADDRNQPIKGDVNTADPAAVFVDEIYTEDGRYKLRAGGEAISTTSSFEKARAAIASKQPSASGSAWLAMRCAQDSLVYTFTQLGNTGRSALTEFTFPGRGPARVLIQVVRDGVTPDQPLKCPEGGE